MPATLSDPVYIVWSTLRNEGFDTAVQRATALTNDGVTSQLHADLHASAGFFEQAYHSASQARGESARGTHYARLALFADALGNHAAAQHYSEHAVATQPIETAIEWITWLTDVCNAHSAAAHMLRAYCQHAPDDARAPWWLAIVLASLPDGDAERREALARAYALNPAVHPALPLQLALAYREIREWDAVERVCIETLAKNPADTEMAWQLSNVQWKRNDAAAAEATMRAVDAAAPGDFNVVAAIGLYLAEQSRYQESESMFHAALALSPAASLPAVDLAELELRRGDWLAGWSRYEARLTADDREAKNVVSVMEKLSPRWHGEPLAGKTLMLHSERGSGDDIQMIRFLPALAARTRNEGGRLVLAVRKGLQPLFARFYADCVSIEAGPLGKPDYALPIMSLPHVLNLRPEHVNGAAYLHADAQRVAAWRARVNASGADPRLLKIGLVWSGSPTHRRDAIRSIPFAALAPVLALPGIEFHPLTPGLNADVQTLTALGYCVRDLTAHYEAGFDDVAAHVTALDAVVTIDSAPLHLCGALGRPVLAMLDHVSHWCWGNAETQAWYDSAEFYRQPRPGAWDAVVERVVLRLQNLAASRP